MNTQDFNYETGISKLLIAIENLVSEINSLENPEPWQEKFVKRYEENLLNIAFNPALIDRLEMLINEQGRAKLPKALKRWISANPAASKFLNKTYIDWWWAHKNYACMELIEEYSATDKKKINWGQLSKNPHPRAIKMIEEYLDKYPDNVSYNTCYDMENGAARRSVDQQNVSAFWLSANPSATGLLKKHKHLVRLNALCMNPHPDAIKMIAEVVKKNQNHRDMDWNALSANPGALNILKQYRNRIVWKYASSNPAMIELLKSNPFRINWAWASSNPAMIDMLQEQFKKNPMSIDLKHLLKRNFWDPYLHSELLKKTILRESKGRPSELLWKTFQMRNYQKILKENEEFEKKYSEMFGEFKLLSHLPLSAKKPIIQECIEEMEATTRKELIIA